MSELLKKFLWSKSLVPALIFAFCMAAVPPAICDENFHTEDGGDHFVTKATHRDSGLLDASGKKWMIPVESPDPDLPTMERVIDRERKSGSDKLPESLFKLANNYCDGKNYKKAEPLYLEVLKIEKVNPNSTLTAATLHNLGVLCDLDKRPSSAVDSYLLRALQTWQNQAEKNWDALEREFYSLGNFYLSRNLAARAAQNFKSALEIVDDKGLGDAKGFEALDSLEGALKKQGKHEEALQCANRRKEMLKKHQFSGSSRP